MLASLPQHRQACARVFHNFITLGQLIERVIARLAREIVNRLYATAVEGHVLGVQEIGLIRFFALNRIRQ